MTVYVLRSLLSGKRYVGQTANLQRRLKAHNSGDSKYTKNRGPWQILHTEEFVSRSEAMDREKFFKSGKGREFLDSLTK